MRGGSYENYTLPKERVTKALFAHPGSCGWKFRSRHDANNSTYFSFYLTKQDFI